MPSSLCSRRPTVVMMTSLLAAIFVLLVPIASGKVCLRPEGETRAISTATHADIYIAHDYDAGYVYFTGNSEESEDVWNLIDFNKNVTYSHGSTGCMFAPLEKHLRELFGQCLPKKAKLAKSFGNHELYTVRGKNLSWVVGVTSAGDGQYQRFFSQSENKDGVIGVLVSFSSSDSVSDRSVFNKDLSSCVDINKNNKDKAEETHQPDEL